MASGLLLAFLIWLIYDSSQRNTAADRRNIADLAILTDGLEQWPRALAGLGSNNVYRTGPGASEVKDGLVAKTLYHPVFREYRIGYASRPRCSTERRIVPAGEDGQGTRLVAAGEARPANDRAPLLEGLDRAAGPICYSVALPLGPMLRVREVAPNFSHLLIVSPNGQIVAQVGADPLPLKSVANLPPLRNALLSTLQPRRSGGQAGGGEVGGGALEPIDTEIAGSPYRLYQRPFSLAAAANDAMSSNGYLAVGVVPYERVQAAGMRVSKDMVTAFALAFALLLALLPIIKLRLLGPVDDLTHLETGAVMIGLCIATWVSTMAIAYALLIVQDRTVAETRARTTAAAMASAAGDEIAALFSPDPKSSRLREMVDLVRRPSAGPEPPNVLTLAAGRCGVDCALPRPDSVLLLDGEGGQLAGTPVVTFRAGAGAYSNVAEREYFKKALHRDFPAPDPKLFRPAIPCLERGFALEQVRSLPDGIARTVFGIPVDASRPACVPPGARQRPAVLVAAVVLRSLTSPLLRRDVEFMVVDREDPRLLTLFHSVEPRALVESLQEHSRGPELRAALASLTGEPGGLTSFVADYDGAPHIFAAALVPGTSWAVLTHVDRRRIDERTADITLGALWLAVALAATAVFLMLCCWLRARQDLWIWLWPNAHYVDGYGALKWPLAGMAGLAGLILLIVWAARGWPAPRPVYIAVAVVIPAIAVLWLWIQLGRSPAADAVRKRSGIPAPCGREDRRLTPAAERNYATAVILLLLLLMVLPALAQIYDSAAFVHQAEARGESRWLELRRKERDRRLLGIARTYQPELRRRRALPFDTCSAGSSGVYVLREKVSTAPTMLGLQRQIAFHRSEPTASVRPCGIAPEPKEAGNPLAAYLLILLFVFFLCILLWTSIQAVLRGLFGFGIALEAVEQPGLKDDWDWEKAPRQTLVVGAPVDVQTAIREDQEPETKVRVVDLVTETDTEAAKPSVDEIGRGERVVIENLELLLRDPFRRYRALRFLELLAAKQRRVASIKVVVLTDLSPLERLLQRFERDFEVLEKADKPEARQQLDDIKRNREDVRWSRLFASFATFSHRRLSENVPEDAGAVLIPEKQEDDPLSLEQRQAVAQQVLQELAPLPAHVVRGGLPWDARTVDDLKHRVARELNAASPAAVVDHFTSVFIEHYQLIWSASSHAERLIMYHLAYRRMVNIERAYAVRTLVRRGLVVLDPVPRLFSCSFAQFVRNVEKPETLTRWRRDAPTGAWAKAQLPMLLLVPVGLAVLLVLVKQSGQSVLTLAPILVTAVPSLLQALGVLRRPATG